MAKKIIFAIYDKKVQSYQVPFFSTDEINAVRAVSQYINIGESMLSQFAVDYDLYKIGEFDDVTGKISTGETNEFIISCYTIQSNVIKSAQLRSKLEEAASQDNYTQRNPVLRPAPVPPDAETKHKTEKI